MGKLSVRQLAELEVGYRSNNAKYPVSNTNTGTLNTLMKSGLMSPDRVDYAASESVTPSDAAAVIWRFYVAAGHARIGAQFCQF